MANIYACRIAPYAGAFLDAFFEADDKSDAEKQARDQAYSCGIRSDQIEKVIVIDCATETVPETFGSQVQ